MVIVGVIVGAFVGNAIATAIVRGRWKIKGQYMYDNPSRKRGVTRLLILTVLMGAGALVGGMIGASL